MQQLFFRQVTQAVSPPIGRQSMLLPPMPPWLVLPPMPPWLVLPPVLVVVLLLVLPPMPLVLLLELLEESPLLELLDESSSSPHAASAIAVTNTAVLAPRK
jgi:hypothetical protein